MDASEMARKRWAGMTRAQRKAAMPDPFRAGLATWDGWSEEEISAEMKRRAKVRRARKKREE